MMSRAQSYSSDKVTRRSLKTSLVPFLEVLDVAKMVWSNLETEGTHEVFAAGPTLFQNAKLQPSES